MVAFTTKLFSAIYLSILFATSASANPTPLYKRHATHRTRHFGRDLKLEVFHPPTNFETFGEGLAQTTSENDRTRDLPSRAKAFVQSKLNVNAEAITFKSGYTDEAGTFAYVKQTHEGVPFINAVANVAWKEDNVVAFGSSFVDSKKIAGSTPGVTVESVIPKVEEALNAKFNGHPTTVEYLARDDGTVSLVHVIQVQNEEVNSWFEAYVDAHTGELISLTDFVAEASYTVLPITLRSIPDGVQTLTDPADLLSSPLGWHATSTSSFTTTTGNNVVAYKGSTTNVTSQSSATLNFNYNYNTGQAPTTTGNVDAARVNAFYVINSIHDLTYRYGFTEAAFNFQTDNLGKGGVANDRVLMSVQDSSGTNNANFATPPDGQSGQCRMFIWTLTSPNRDGSLENDIPIHEMTHGVTNRMTGGGTGRCLQTTESGGMGEGWSDAMADWNWQKSATVANFVLGDYVTNSTAGIRTHPYSTSASTNPLRYSSIKTLNEVHNIGEVWANMLHNVYAGLVGAHGFDGGARTNPSSTAGNAVFLHLFLDALRLQPCNPTFVNARDAWIQADANRYAGANKCVIWNAFASRGLGVGAANFVDSTTVPSGC